MADLEQIHATIPHLVAVFTFVIIISGNYLGELFPCKVQHFFSESMILKHFLGYLTLMFFVVLTIPEISESGNIIVSSALMYSAFVLVSKTHYRFWFAIFGITGVVYLLHMFKKTLPITKKEETTEETPKMPTINELIDTVGMSEVSEFMSTTEPVNEEDKDKIEEEQLDKNKALVGKIEIANTLLTAVVFLITATGFVTYIGEKKHEYGKKFSYAQFLLGKPSCQNNDLKYNSVLKSLSYAFK